MRRVLINIYSYIQYLPNKPLYKWLNALPRPNVENFVFFQGNNLNNQSNQYGGVHPWIAHPKRAFFRFGGVPTPPHTPPRSIPGAMHGVHQYFIVKFSDLCWSKPDFLMNIACQTSSLFTRKFFQVFSKNKCFWRYWSKILNCTCFFLTYFRWVGII